MSKYYFIGIFLLIFTVLSAQTGQKIYQMNCAGCHGAQLQGGSASALVKQTWKYGGDKKSITKSIANGIKGTTMMKWQGALSQKEIAAVTDFIIEAQKKPLTVKPIEAPKEKILETKDYKLTVETLISEGLGTPWGIEFVDKNKAIISDKNGKLYWMLDGKLDKQAITGNPKTYAVDMYGGYMDVALDPNYAQNGWIYLAFSHNPNNAQGRDVAGMTKIVRGKINDHQWTDEQTLFQVHDSLFITGGMRWGCRFLFDKQGYLYFSIGDMNKGEDSQIPTRPSGKIFRINPDGSIPKDNPYYGKTNHLEAIYTLGNRNVQGIAQHPETGVIYATEHGPRGGDELNIIKNGANYGWPVITYGIDYSGAKVSDFTEKEGMEQPVKQWTPSIAICAAEFVHSDKFPLWRNNLMVTALQFQELRRLVIDGNKVLEDEIIMKGQGRVRDVKMGPDGAMYVLTNSPDAVLRIVPK
jgi:glucose/arabinose dehydrogenase